MGGTFKKSQAPTGPDPRCPPPVTQAQVVEAVASAYGDRHPESRQWEREEMGRAAWARLRRRHAPWVELD